MTSKTTVKFCFTPEEDERLVESISTQPVIYDLGHPLYKDQRAKENIWIAVSDEVRRTVSDCKKRWRNIKDTLDRKMRENKAGSDVPPCKKGKKWQLEEHLSFLHNARRSVYNNNDEDKEGSGHDEQDDSVGFNISENEQETPTPADIAAVNSHIPLKHLVPRKTSTKNHTERPKKVTRREDISYTIEKHLRDRDTMVKNLVLKNDEKDDVSLFFKSIAKSVQKMPPYLQQRAKLETLTLITNIESDMWSLHEESSGSNEMFMIPSPETSMRSDVSALSSTSPDARR